MAKRTNKPLHDEATKRRIAATQLINRLILFASGKVKMSSAQVLAARVVIGKVIPDLKSIEHTGKDGGPIKHDASLSMAESYLRMVRGS